MWTGLHISPEVDPEFSSSVIELLRSTSRHLIGALACVYLAFVLATAIWPEQLAVNIWLGLPLMLASSVTALRLLSQRYWAAQVVWQAGLAGLISLAVYLFQAPEIAFLYALLPMIAVVTVGWPAGILAEAIVCLLAWWLPRGLVDGAVPGTYGAAISLGGVIAGLTGWASTRALLTVTEWSLSSFRQAQRKVHEALEQRLELKQTQQDLMHANQELARLSDRLRAMYRIAEEARRAKEEFVANVSHELRTPLNMIIGFSEMIVESPQVYGSHLPPALLNDIATIHLNSRHLAKLIDDVLDLSQVEAGRMSLSRAWTSLSRLIDEAVLAVRPLYESRSLYLETEVSPDLPEVYCDSTRVRQVILNLLSNAGRFTETGGVRVRAWRDQERVVVSVTDTGPGIAPEDRATLFEPFRQLESSIRRRHGGSGLGLSISKRFVEMHGGQMWVESQVGQGATFFFSLPLEAPLPGSPRGTDGITRWVNPYSEFEYRARTRRSRAPAPGVVPRFVLVDEGKTLRRLFARYLEGYELVSVPDTRQATDEVTRSPADVVVVNAPPHWKEMGYLDWLAALPYDTPAVICSVPSEDETARHLGVVSYLIKPVTREELLGALDALPPVKRLLVVDDEPDALQLTARMLASAGRGYRVLRACDGRRALTLLRERRPDAVLLDLMMPQMDGFRVLYEKSRDPSIRDIPVIVISARDPSGEPIISPTLTIARSGGLSVRQLLACIQAVSAILTPSERAGGREQPENPSG